jgi:antitoxin component YwqK of YwqJK toxin-antitoxin module
MMLMFVSRVSWHHILSFGILAIALAWAEPSCRAAENIAEPALQFPSPREPALLASMETPEGSATETKPELTDIPASDAIDSTAPNELTEVIQERHPNGTIRLERHVMQDANDNFLNHGSWVMFNDRGHETARGEYRQGKRTGIWVRTHVSVRELDLGLAPNAAQFTPPFLSVAQFTDGELNGSWAVLDSRERKMVMLNYAQGRRDGKSVWYSPGGAVWREIEYKLGVRDGEFVEYAVDRSPAKHYTYVAGSRIEQQIEWYSRGVKKLEAAVLHTPEYAGTIDDWWAGSSRELPIEQQRVGRASVSLQVVGMRHGAWRVWHPNGQPAASGKFENDAPVGPFTWWHTNGQMACEGQYERAQPVGRWVWWHANGQRESQGTFATGVQTGRWLWWDAQGQVAKSASFAEDGAGLQMSLRPEGVVPPVVDVDTSPTTPLVSGSQSAKNRPTPASTFPAASRATPAVWR